MNSLFQNTRKIVACFLFLTHGYGNSQVPKKVVVEHFTNSLCGICASRNPGFYGNLSAQTNLIHLAVHPSSPYSNCLLNKHNTIENDARTNYYGVYGSTPRLVIQGSVISSGANYSDAAIFSTYLNKTSPASIKITQWKYNNDSVRVRVVIKTEATHNLGNLSLFVCLAEDTLFYSSPNGESKHFDVFRKSFTGTSGTLVNLPATVGDSVIYTAVTNGNASWVASRIYPMAILQNASTKEVIQAQSISAKSNNVKASISSINGDNKTIKLWVSNNKTLFVQKGFHSTDYKLVLVDLSGRMVFEKKLETNEDKFDISFIDNGVYLYLITSGSKITQKGKLAVR